MTPNIYSGGSLDRAGLLRRDAADLARRMADPCARLVPLWRTHNLVLRDDDGVRAVCPRANGSPWLAALRLDPLYLGALGGVDHFAVDLSALDDPTSLDQLTGEFVDLRTVGAVLSRDEANLLAFARGLVHWHGGHGFCGRCGAPTVSRDGGHRRQCTAPGCGADHFPRTDPAVIVLVSAGEYCLLGRQARWLPGMLSTLAGFVEPGETLEEAVAREVFEEAGVQVGRLRYHSSQPWPFPGSLMVGFMAEVEAQSALKVDSHELEYAAWFSRADIARFPELGHSLPRPDSIARRLITDWLDG